MCSDFWLVLLAVISSYGRESLKGLSNFFSLSASLSISRQWIIVVYRFVMSSHSNTYPTDILAVVLLSVRAVTSPLLAVNSEWPYKRNFYRNWHNRFISYFFGGEGLWRINCHSLTFKDSYCNTDLVIHRVLVLNVLRIHIAISEEKKSEFFFGNNLIFFIVEVYLNLIFFCGHCLLMVTVDGFVREQSVFWRKQTGTWQSEQLQSVFLWSKQTRRISTSQNESGRRVWQTGHGPSWFRWFLHDGWT